MSLDAKLPFRKSNSLIKRGVRVRKRQRRKSFSNFRRGPTAMTRPSLAVLLGPSPRVGAQDHFPASGIERCARPSNGLALCLSTRMAAARAYACVSVRGQRAPEAELAQEILFLQRPIESRGHPTNSRTPDPALGVGDASTRRAIQAAPEFPSLRSPQLNDRWPSLPEPSKPTICP